MLCIFQNLKIDFSDACNIRWLMNNCNILLDCLHPLCIFNVANEIVTTATMRCTLCSFLISITSVWQCVCDIITTFIMPEILIIYILYTSFKFCRCFINFYLKNSFYPCWYKMCLSVIIRATLLAPSSLSLGMYHWAHNKCTHYLVEFITNIANWSQRKLKSQKSCVASATTCASHWSYIITSNSCEKSLEPKHSHNKRVKWFMTKIYWKRCGIVLRTCIC